MAIKVINPKEVIAAYETDSGKFIIEYTDTNSVSITVVTSDGETHQRIFSGLTTGSIEFVVNKYIQGFTIPDADIYREFSLAASSLIKSYRAQISSGGSIFGFNGEALCSISLEEIEEPNYITSNGGEVISSNIGINIGVGYANETEFRVLTNRPAFSKAHHQGHITFHIYNEVKPDITVLVDGIAVDVPDFTGNEQSLYALHIPSDVFKNAEMLTVTIGTEVYKIKIVHRACKSYTIAWLNPLGGIDHYTFYTAKEEAVSTEKEKILTNDGYNTIWAVRENEFTAYSDLENKEISKWIAEIISSPRTWLIDNGEIIPIDMISSEAVYEADDVLQIEINFRLIKPVTLQRP